MNIVFVLFNLSLLLCLCEHMYFQLMRLCEGQVQVVGYSVENAA